MDSQKEQIIQTADRMFRQFGIRNISIDQVCSEIRISKKTFYLHFKQKENVIDAVIVYDKAVLLEKLKKNL